jgi:ABC-type multidrug transport system fused ATPase/permease subunit
MGGAATRKQSRVERRLRRAWRVATFGSPNAGRRAAALAVLGAISGLGEAAVIVLVIALASGGGFGGYPLADQLPSSSWALMALSFGTVVLLAVAHLGSARLAAGFGAETQRTLQDLIVTAYLAAPWPAQATMRSGELQDLVGVRVNALAAGSQEAGQALASAVNLAVLVATAVVIRPYAALGLLLAVGSVALVSRLLRSRRRRAIRLSAQAASGLALDVTETADTARELRVFGSTAAARERLRGRINEAARLSEAARFVNTASVPLTRDVTVALLVLALGVVVAQSTVVLPVLGSTVVLMLRALAHAQSLTGLGVRLLEREDHLEWIEARLSRWRPRHERGAQRCPPVTRLAVRNVGYRYPSARRGALEAVSLELERGELVGIVGRTGAGKSTLAGILLGLLPPDSGDVLVEGLPLHTLDPDDWHARTAWVGQEPRLITATVRENIRFLRREIPDPDVERAARLAGLAPELELWPEGVDHEVGPAGAAVSGGQRQRIALARALAGRPELLVLDEPTSALDAHAEVAVRDALERIRHEVIAVVIAHRLTTVRACDRIVVIESGRIEAVGSPQELGSESDYFQQVLELSRS